MKITVIRSGDFMIPTDEAYGILRKHNLRQTRIAVPLFDTLTKLMFDPLGMEVEVLNMRDVFNEWLDKVEAAWTKIPSTRIHNARGLIRLETTHPAVYSKAKAALPKVEAAMERFFTRYGAQYQITSSETPTGKVRIAVTYKFGARNPVVAVLPQAADVVGDECILTLGFTRIILSTDRTPMGQGKYKILSVQTKAGDNWKPVHTSRFLPGQIEIGKGVLDFLIGNSEGFLEPTRTNVIPLDESQLDEFADAHKKRLNSILKPEGVKRWHRSALSMTRDMSDEEKDELRQWHEQQLLALGPAPTEAVETPAPTEAEAGTDDIKDRFQLKGKPINTLDETINTLDDQQATAVVAVIVSEILDEAVKANEIDAEGHAVVGADQPEEDTDLFGFDSDQPPTLH